MAHLFSACSSDACRKKLDYVTKNHNILLSARFVFIIHKIQYFATLMQPAGLVCRAGYLTYTARLLTPAYRLLAQQRKSR